jgi:hypothetical protein
MAGDAHPTKIVLLQLLQDLSENELKLRILLSFNRLNLLAVGLEFLVG